MVRITARLLSPRLAAAISPTAPALCLAVNASFAALSVNLNLVNASATDLFLV